MNIRELSQYEFKEFTQVYSISSIYQTVEYANSINKEDIIYLGMFDSKKIYAATMLYIEKNGIFKYAYAPRGFLIDYNNSKLVDEFTTLIKNYLKKKKIVSITLNPMIIKKVYDYTIDGGVNNSNFENIFKQLKNLGYKHKGFNDRFESLFPRFEGYIDINLKPNVIFDRFYKNLKTKLRSADLAGIRIHKGTVDDLDKLYEMSKYKYNKDINFFKDIIYNFKDNAEIYYAQMDTSTYLRYIQLKYQKVVTECTKYNEIVFRNAGKGNNNKAINNKIKAEQALNIVKEDLVSATALLQNYPSGLLLASCLIIKSQKEIVLFMDGYNTEYKKFNGKHLLLWKIIENYANKSFDRFNIGGMVNYNIKDGKYKGLNDFKASFGSKQIEYIGDLELICDSPSYYLSKVANLFSSKKKV